MASRPPDFVTGLTACLPLPEVLQAIGQLWVRLSQLEAWVDVTIGKLLALDWPATHAIISKAGINTKIGIAQSGLELRIQRLGTSQARDEIKCILLAFDKIRKQRNVFAHGRFLLEVPGEVGQLVKSKVTKKEVIAYDYQDIFPEKVQAISSELRDLAN